MAYHEQHERACPTCGERISATAPRCFNCGEFVDRDEEDDADQEAEEGTPWATRGRVLGVVALLAGVGLIIFLVRGRQAKREDEAVAAAKQLAPLVGQMARRESLNASSPMALAEVEPHLRAGMPFEEGSRLVSRKNDGPLNSTVIAVVPLPGAEAADQAKQPQAYIIYLKDANLVVHTDGENVVSWKSEPIR